MFMQSQSLQPEKTSLARRDGGKYYFFSSQAAVAAWSVLVIMLMEAFAVFHNGAYFQDAMTLCVAISWTVVLLLLFASRGIILSKWGAMQMALLGLACAFWLWVGLSLLWSISRDATWIEFNRTGGYVALLFSGIVVGRYSFARRLAVVLFLIVVTAAAIYGLGPKALPATIDNLDDMGRIAVPIGYVNAMGLLMALGYVFSIYISAARDFHWGLRIFSVLAAPLILACMFFTTSRGAAIALVFGFIVFFALVPMRLRSFGATMLSVFPVLFIAIWANGQDTLMKDSVALEDRLVAATSLRLYLLFAVVGAGAVFVVALLAGANVNFPTFAKKFAGAAIIITLLLTTITGIMLFVSSQPSIVDWADNAYQTFRYSNPSKSGAARFLDMSSSGRWLIWEEAIDNLRDNPVKGTGGQSFPLVHLMRRESDEVFVKQPHGHPFQLLAELGLVGFMLSMAFMTVSLAYCTLLICRLCDRWERALAGAILSMIVVYLIHAAYDWDWNIFALTMVWFFFTGILVGWPRPAGGSIRPEDSGNGPLRAARAYRSAA